MIMNLVRFIILCAHQFLQKLTIKVEFNMFGLEYLRQIVLTRGKYIVFSTSSFHLRYF